MNRTKRRMQTAALAALIGGGALLPFQAQAASLAPVANIEASAATNRSVQYGEAVNRLIGQGVLQGYEDGQIRPDKPVKNAELLKMVLLALDLEADGEEGAQWYDRYVAAAARHGLIAESDKLAPNAAANSADMTAFVAKALQRDVKSVRHWMDQLAIDGRTVTRGDAAMLLVHSQAAIRSADAKIVSVKALNNITLEVTFDSPMTIEDETTAAANENFAFDGGLRLVNQPRLKTGAIATYIVPVVTMTEQNYKLSYKGAEQLDVASSSEKLQLNEARQVTADTFEVDSFRADGVIDYGYLISAYSGGRGANAVVLGEDNTLDGKPMQIISSLASRQAVLTPEGGQPITVSYVGFTQSTDGKQEPKFRLPQGQTLQPGVKYTVSADWFEARSASFVAAAVDPLVIAAAEAVNETTLNVSLSADPGDELFAYRSVKLEGSDGTSLTAQYKVQTRKGETGVFEIQNGGKLLTGVTYKLLPAGAWATSPEITISL
ncbi:S-layer homology domain-containing protein [Paenibacillus soyae]|uniref:S-layer homology domain-containing protein n=1 Tax=Paenibacillus soyae TaxID=2969249 RepID=A0A9X2MLA1_9BACL|nr:S-layer homology domain-containing protein [Paenibacillus soyae]MCR2802410.1 S-layer homology domain-containing protein [Paenibacillus soyae]